MVGRSTADGPWHVAAQQELLYASHEGAHSAALFKPLLEVAGFVQLGVQPAVFESRGISAEFVVLTTRLQCVVSCLSRQHACFNGRVAAFDAAGIEVASFAANEGAARKYCFGQ